jgi:hypothetical protein
MLAPSPRHGAYSHWSRPADSESQASRVGRRSGSPSTWTGRVVWAHRLMMPCSGHGHPSTPSPGRTRRVRRGLGPDRWTVTAVGAPELASRPKLNFRLELPRSADTLDVGGPRYRDGGAVPQLRLEGLRAGQAHYKRLGWDSEALRRARPLAVRGLECPGQCVQAVCSFHARTRSNQAIYGMGQIIICSVSVPWP